MKKQDTINEHKARINEVLFHIHKYLSNKLLIEDLAKVSSYSPFHFQRIFKDITKRSVIDYIKEIRLQWAANLLIFNPNRTITNIAFTCGFSSSSTFSSEFKRYYNTTPNSWRSGEYKNHKPKNYEQTQVEIDFSKIEIKQIPSVKIAYMRHQGYDKTIKEMWNKFLFTLEDEYGVTNHRMMAFHHNNPNITKLEDFRYKACIDLEDVNIQAKGDIGICALDAGLFATMRFEGICEDILTLYKKLYHEWLPNSQYEALNSSAHIYYYKNNYLNDEDKFDIEFRIPIRYQT